MKTSQRFLQAVLGKDGAKALFKAAEREPSLDGVLVPRTLLSWLQFSAEHSYEGPIPSCENSYVQFEKSGDGYSGSVSLNEGIYEFQAASVYHLAASIAMALEIPASTLDASIRDAVLVRLGKSIDTLVKAQVLTQQLSKKGLAAQRMTTHGEFHVEHSGIGSKPYSVVHTRTNAVVQPGIASLKDASDIANWHHAKHQKSVLGKVEGPGSAHKQTAQVGPQGPEAPTKQPKMTTKKIPSMAVGKSEANAACEVCGGQQFNGNKFRGCICFSDLSKNIKTTAYGDGFVLEFDSNIDRDAAKALMQALRKSNG